MILDRRKQRIKFSDVTISKLNKCLDIYRKLSEVERTELNNLISPSCRDLLNHYLISKESIEKYNDEKYSYVKDYRSNREVALTFIVNEILEALTLVYFNKEGLLLEFNKKATRVDKDKNINANSDFVLKYNGQIFFVELQVCVKPNEVFVVKQSKHNKLKKEVEKGKNIVLLTKYLVGNEVYYTFINYNDVIKGEKYSIPFEGNFFGGKPCVQLNVNERKIKTFFEFTF